MKTIEWHLLKLRCLYIALNNIYILLFYVEREFWRKLLNYFKKWIHHDRHKLNYFKKWSHHDRHIFVKINSRLANSRCFKNKNSNRYFSCFFLIYLVNLVTKIRHWKGWIIWESFKLSLKIYLKLEFVGCTVNLRLMLSRWYCSS